MENTFFTWSTRSAQSPPPTPSVAPEPTLSPQPASQRDAGLEVISTQEIQSWMSSIERCLNEVSTIATEGKLNSDQKSKIHTLCRKVGHNTSMLAVQYQALKLKAVQSHNYIGTLEEQFDMSQTIQDLKRSIEESKKPLPSSSFAAIVKKGNNMSIEPLNLSSVAIYPKDKLKSSEETKSIVQKIVRPEKINLHVRGLRKTKDGGIIISTDTKEDMEKLKRQVQSTNSGLKCDEPYKRKPRIVVIGVPTSMMEKDVFNYIYQQNLAGVLQDVSLEKFLQSIKLSHKSGKRNADTCNYVIEVSAAIRKALITKERVFINWSSCPVKDFTLVTRCYKCQQYGHAAKTCRESTYTCSNCGEQGHSMNVCLNLSGLTTKPKCATCLRFKKPCNHPTGAIDCPARIMAEKRLINSIDYSA